MLTEARAFLRERRTVRHFLPTPVPDSILREVLLTATFAPSAHNLQPWRFAVIQTPALKSELGAAITAKMRRDMELNGVTKAEIDKRMTASLRRIDEAPAMIALCRDIAARNADTLEETYMNIQSVALAGLQLLLAARAEGLGGNWICWALYAPQEICAILKLPETWQPQAFFFLGYPAEEPPAKERKSIEEVIKTL